MWLQSSACNPTPMLPGYAGRAPALANAKMRMLTSVSVWLFACGGLPVTAAESTLDAICGPRCIHFLLNPAAVDLGLENCGNYPGHCFDLRTCVGCMKVPDPNDPERMTDVCQAQNPQQQTPFVDHIPTGELCRAGS